MRLSDYAKKVGDALRDAHNSKDMAALEGVFERADATLDRNSVSKADRQTFWAAVREAMNAGRWRIEHQANSSLLALMQAIQQGLAARGSK